MANTSTNDPPSDEVDKTSGGGSGGRPTTAGGGLQRGSRFVGKRQVVIQNLDLSPLKLDDPPPARGAARGISTTAKSSRVPPPLGGLNFTDGASRTAPAPPLQLRSDRAGARVGASNRATDRMSTGPVDLAVA